MVDNFERIKDYLRQKGLPEKYDRQNIPDLYFTVEIVRRAKDHKEMGSSNYHFKNYYVTSIEGLDKIKDEVITICETFGMRAYISVNRKSFRAVTMNTIAELATLASKNDYRKPYSVYESCSGKYVERSDKTWIVDIDDDQIDNIGFFKYWLNELRPDHDTIICELPTNSGIHLLTKPFNRDKFNNECQVAGINTPDIKLNHLTALYANI